MSTVSAKFTSVSAAITFSSCANGDYCSSGVIDNTSALYEDFIVDLAIETASSGSVATPYTCTVYISHSVDGTNYVDAISASATNSTIPGTINSAVAAVIQTPSSGNSYTGRKNFNVAKILGGAPPYKFIIWVANNTGLTLQAGAITVQGVQHTIA